LVSFALSLLPVLPSSPLFPSLLANPLLVINSLSSLSVPYSPLIKIRRFAS
jgi:hypothetical protein